MDLYAIDGISLESVSAKITKLTDEKKALEEELESLIPAAPALLPSTAKEIVAGMKDILDTGTLEERRKIVDALISRIVFQVNGDIDIYWKFI